MTYRYSGSVLVSWPTYKKFPAGNTAFYPSNVGQGGWGGGQGGAAIANNGQWYHGMMSWSAAIMPYIEGTTVYNNINFSARPYCYDRADTWFPGGTVTTGPDPSIKALDPANPPLLVNQLAAGSAPPSFVCPSSPSQARVGSVKDYAMNAGIGQYPNATPTAAQIAQGISGTRLSSCCPERSNTGGGIGNKNFWCSIGSITDGTSNTFLILEQSHAIANFPASTNQFLWLNHNSQGLAVALQVGRNYPPNPDPLNQFMTKKAGGWGLAGRCSWGWHIGGVMTAMADGSVQFVTDSIALPAWRRLHGRDDGQVAELPQ